MAAARKPVFIGSSDWSRAFAAAEGQTLTRTERGSIAMKKWAIIVAVALTAAGGLVTAGALAAEAARMDKDDLKARLGDPNVVILDVRSHTDWFFSGDQIRGALRENYRDFEGWYAKYPKDKTIVLYCA